MRHVQLDIGICNQGELGSRRSEAESIIRDPCELPANWKTTAALHHALCQGKEKLNKSKSEKK